MAAAVILKERNREMCGSSMSPFTIDVLLSLVIVRKRYKV